MIKCGAQYRGTSAALLSLRGIAACGVMLAHASNTFAVDGLTIGNIGAFETVPMSFGATFNLWFQVLCAPNAAVTFFFVHSGFVLSLSLSQVDWAKGAGREMAAYVMRRVFRIWPMIVVACVMASAYRVVYPPVQSPSYTAWFAAFFSAPITPRYLWGNIALQTYDLVPFMWSLTLEVYGSLVIPLIFFLVTRRRAGWLFLFIGFVLALLMLPNAPMPVLFRGVTTWTVAYMFSFALGAAIPFLEVRTRPAWWNSGAAVLASFVALTLVRHSGVFDVPQSVVVESLPAAVVIYAIYYRDDGLFQKFCCLALVKFLGEISYSIYVNALLCTHIVVVAMLLLLGDALIIRHGAAMNILAAAMVLPVCAGVSALTFYWIERPLMRLGRRLGDMIKSARCKLPASIAP